MNHNSNSSSGNSSSGSINSDSDNSIINNTIISNNDNNNNTNNSRHIDISPSLGLIKLTEYLNQTRRQSEMAIDSLNDKINELTTDNDKALKLIEKYQNERDYYRNYAEQLKLQNNKKWKLQERDDWKSLVESVQNDRSRLQDDCNTLTLLLNDANNRIAILENQLNDYINQNNNNDNSNNDTNTNIPSSPSHHHHQNQSSSSSSLVPSTPTTQIRTLKTELEKLTYEREIERKNIETQKKAKGIITIITITIIITIIIAIIITIIIEVEISRLKEELKIVKEQRKMKKNIDSNNVLVSKSPLSPDGSSWGWIGLFFATSNSKPSTNSAILRV